MRSFTHSRLVFLIVMLAALFTLPAAAQIPAHIKVNTTLGGSPVELNLSNYSIRSADFRVQSWDSTSGYVVENLPSRQYRGYVTENPNWLVVAVIDTDNTLDATVFNGSVRLYTLSSIDVSSLLGGSSPPALPTTAVPTNGVTVVGSGSQAPPRANMPPVDTYSAHGVYDVSSRYYLGTVEATLAQREYAWNILDYFNMRDGKLNMLLTEVIIRKEQFYFPTTGNAGQFNGMLHTEWLAQGVNRRGFIASMFPINFTYAGGYASGNSFYDAGSEAICVNSLYHEGAHNWRAQHWLYGVDTMSGSAPAHGAMNVERVLYTRALEIAQITPSNGLELTTNAVSLVHPYGYPDIATTLTNTPVDIAVLANDWDANGETLSIRYHTTNTVQGGTVTQSGNVLTYTPATGYVGKDMIIYEVQDTTGLYTEEVVHIEVVNQGLAAHWAFEDASGSIATDGSGNSHAGTLSGATFGGSTIAGPVSNAISLAAGQYMVCDSTDLIAEPEFAYPVDARASNFFDPMDESFTATCWFRLKGSQSVTLFDKDNPGAIGYLVWASPGGLSARTRPWNAVGSTYTVSSGALQENGWYHMAMVINRSDNSLRLYLNGAEVGTAATLPANDFIFNGREDLVIGGGAAVDIDEAQIHTKALSLAELQALYNAGTVPAGGPQPVSGSINQSLNTVLGWLTGHPSYQHDVYFGTNSAAVAAATTASPEYQGRQSGTSFDPGALEPSSTYFWRIDEVDGGDIIAGELWSFSTVSVALLSDLVLHLTMDDDDVQTADGTTHTFDDIVIPAQDFQVIGDVVPGVTGIIGEAVDLTATNHTDTLRSYVANPVVRPVSGGVTISFWVNTSSAQNTVKMYDAGGAYFMYFHNGDLFTVFDGSSSGSSTFDTNINDGNWHHIVARNDGAGTTTLFVDGTVAGTQSESLHDLASLNRTVSLGSTYNSAGENLDALFDDFAVWQRSLLDSEIAVIHATGLAGQTFNNEAVLVNTSFEVSEGFSGFASGVPSALGTVTDNDGVIWTESDAHIWNRSDIPPAGIQVLTLGLGSSPSTCTVEIPGTTHGVGLVTFDYASFSSGTDTDFSLSYNDNAGSGWVQVWSTHMLGMNPDFTEKPWRTVEIGVYVPGNVDLRFEGVSYDGGVMIDNVRITGKATISNNAPTWSSSPVNETTATASGGYSSTLSDDASDLDSDPLMFVKVSGPVWLNVAADGTLSGTPGTSDVGSNSWVVAVSDGFASPVEETLAITVEGAPALFGDDFERTAGTTIGNGWIEETSDSRIYDTGNGATKMVIHNSSASTPFAIVNQLSTNYVAGDRYELAWSGAKATGASGTLNYSVSIGTWNGSVFTPLATETGSLGGLNLYGKQAGPSVYITAAPSEAGQQIAVRFEVVAGSDDWAGFDDVTVYHLGANTAPAFTTDPFSAAAATEDAAYSATIAGSATDGDPGDILTYSLVSAPGWLNVATNGALSGTPGNSDVGLNAFTVRVTDQGGLTNDATLNITVINTNDDPAFTADPLSAGNATVGFAYSDTIAGSATDIDVGDSLTYSKVGPTPAWLIVAGSGALSGTPGTGDLGPNTFTVQVVDGNGGTNSAVLNITVDAYVMATRSYVGSGTDYTGTNATDAVGAMIWGMDINPINNVANVDVDANGEFDFHALDATNVDPSDGLASNTDGLLFRWDYNNSPARDAGLTSGSTDFTFEVSVNLLGTGTEGSRGVFGLALFAGNAGTFQFEIGEDSVTWGTSPTTSPTITGLDATLAAASNLGAHTWRFAYDGTLDEFWVYKDGTLMNDGGVGIDATTVADSGSSGLIGDYSGDLSGDWELDYIALDATGTYAPPVVVSTPPDITLGGPLGSGADITLSWTGENGIAYGVQTNADLVGGSWDAYISGLLGDGGPITFTNDLDMTEMFFRVIVE